MNLYIQSFLKQTVVFSLMVVLVGCASGSHNPLPTAPEQNSSDAMTGESVPDLTDGNTESNSGQASETGHLLLAYNMIYIDPDHPDGPKAEIIPLREGEIHLNILKFLEDGPCFDCFKIVGFNFPVPGTLDVDIQIDHPFDDLFFSIFDVRGIMMFQGSHEFPVAGKSVSDPNLGDGALLNADGYTALYNGNTLSAPVGDLQKYYPGNFSTPAIPSSDINGYKYYLTDDPANNRNAFYGDSSGTDIQTFSIKLPTGPFVLGYAVDANWWLPIETPVDDPLTDFDLNANCPEPWKIVVTEEPIGDGLTDQGGETKLLIDVYDWQGKDTHHDPVVECPELFDGQLSATWVSDGSDYARYEVTVSNEKLASVGEFWYLVGVEANENNPTGAPWLDLTAYQFQILTVIPKPTQNPVAVAEADPNPQAVNLPVGFSGSDSFDPDGGDIQLYEWDWDYDSMAGFVSDQEGENADHTWSAAGTYYVQLRVTDDESETDLLDDPLEITISDHQPPGACGEADPLSTVVCEPVHFTDCGSVAYDGAEIVLHEWDWDNDGVYDGEGTDLYHTWYDPGTYYVQYRVTDDMGLMDDLENPIEITIINALPTSIAEADTYYSFVGETVHFDGSDSFDNDCGGELIVQWDWDWDNDGVYEGTGENVEHSWNTAGVYNVQLRVTDDETETDILDVPLEITITGHQPPDACGEADPLSTVVCEPVYFTDCGSVAYDGAEIVLHEWDWDNDGEYDEEGTDLYHTWDDPGTFYVQYRVTDDQDAMGELENSLEISVFNIEPTAVVTTVVTEGVICEDILFDGSASHDNDCGGESIESYEWDWNNDGVYDEEGVVVSHIFYDPGPYLVGFQVTDDEGATDELDSPISVVITEELPTAVATVVQTEPIVCASTLFSGSDSFDNDCGGESIDKWEWDWESDGEFDDEGESFYHGFFEVGIFNVNLRVTDNEGSIDELDEPLEINVKNALPTAVAEADNYNPNIGQPVHFDGTGSHDNDCGDWSIEKWEWDFDGDGFYWVDAGPIPMHTYDTFGDYNVQLRVTDDEGETAELDVPLEMVVEDNSPFNLVDVTPPWLNFSPEDIHVDGNYAYTASGPTGMHIFNIVEPFNPVWVNWVDTPGWANEVTVSGGYAYVADESSGLQIIDIEPPGSAHIVNSIDTPGHARGVAVSGGYAYVADWNSGLQIIDIDPPESASLIKTVSVSGFNGDVAVSGGYAYVANEVFGVLVFDVEPPESAYGVMTVNLPGAKNVAVAGSHAYATGIDIGLKILDIELPESAYIVESFGSFDAAGVAVSGEYAYVANGGLLIVDIAPPESVHSVNTIITPGLPFGVALSEEYAYVVDHYSGLNVINIEPPESAYLVDTISTINTTDVAVSGGYAYAVDSYLDFLIIDIDPPESAFIVNSVDISFTLNGLSVSEGYAYVLCNSTSGLKIIDIDPPESAYIVHSVGTDQPKQIAIFGGYAYITENDYGLQIVDIDPPESAFIVNSVVTDGNPLGVGASDGYAFVGNDENDLQIIDIEPPESAFIVNTITTQYWATGIAASGGYAYVTEGVGGIEIIDIEPPESAYLVKTVTISLGYGYSTGIAISGDYAFVADGGAGLRVVDIQPPESAFEIASIETMHEALDVAVSGNYAYVADSRGGLRIIQLY